jgi:hypothetical protein
MAWVTFTADFDFSPAARKGTVTVAYKAGTTDNVTRECLELAIAAAKARRTTSPKAKPVENPEP